MGLGNRVAAMANGLSRADQIQFVWRVNEHLPADHEQIFPTGIPGVEFLRDAEPAFATRWDGCWCYEWDAAEDRATANAAYASIISAMVGRQPIYPWRTSILARFHRNPDRRPEEFAAKAIRILRGERSTEVFLLSDIYRDAISTALLESSIRPIIPQCLEIPSDLDRIDEDIIHYCSDWKMLLACGHIIALDGPASALHPARAAGIQISYI